MVYRKIQFLPPLGIFHPPSVLPRPNGHSIHIKAKRKRHDPSNVVPRKRRRALIPTTSNSSSTETEKATKSDASDHTVPVTNPESGYDPGYDGSESEATGFDVNDPDATVLKPPILIPQSLMPPILMPKSLMLLDVPESDVGKCPSTLHRQICKEPDDEL